MGEKITVELKERTAYGKKVKQLRESGIVPVNIYGNGISATEGQLDRVALDKIIAQAGKHTPVHVEIAGKKHLALIKDITYDRVRHLVDHVSFYAIRQNQPVVTTVAIEITGEDESEAKKAGLVILQSLEKIEIKALPKNLPEVLEVSADNLKAEGDKLTIGDIVLPSGVEYVVHEDTSSDDDEQYLITDTVIATAYEPAALQAANEAAAGDAESEDEVEIEGEDKKADDETSDEK